VVSKPCITPASKAQADSESGVRLRRMSIYERPAIRLRRTTGRQTGL
jgi:hypothetical protein